MRRIGKWLFPWAVGALCVALPAAVAFAQAQEEAGEEGETMIEQELEKIGTVIYFEFDSAELDEQAKGRLDEVARWLEGNENRKVLIFGHTDEVGPEEYNFELGGKRAMAAESYLVAQGIDEARIATASFGETQPTSMVQAENRRAIFFSEREREEPVAEAEIREEEREFAPEEPEVAEPEIEEEEIELEPEEPFEEEPLEEPFAEEPAPPEFAVPDEEPKERPPHLITPAGMSVNVGGGVMNFFDDDMRGFTDVAGTWEARIVYGTRTRFAGEVAYIGTAQDVNALGLDDDAVLISNGAEGVARVNGIMLGDVFQTYAFAGFGFARYDIVNEDFNTSNVDGEETVFHVPLGLGAGFRWVGLMFDVRGTVRPAFDDSLVEGGPNQGADMHNWAVTGKVGWEF